MDTTKPNLSNGPKLGAPQRHPDAAKMPDEFSAALRERTGNVNDVRRLVTFIYLAMRDVVPCGVIGDAHRIAMETPLTPLPPPGEQPMPSPIEMVSSRPTDRLDVFLRHLFQHGEFAGTLRQLSPHDDVECAFTNGHLARYAQLLADDLTTDVQAT